MMKKIIPLISIIIPTQNRVRTSEFTLDAYLTVLRSASVTTGITFEFVVVDDHSNDGTLERLHQKFNNDPEVRLIHHTESTGPGPARDFGLSSTQGEWIWFLDDDDTLNIEATIALMHFMRAAPVSIDIISHSLKQDYPSASSQNRQFFTAQILAYREHQEVFRHLIRRSMLVTEDIHFSTGLHEDIRYVLELTIKARGLEILPLQVVNKIRSNHAITSEMNSRRIDGYIQAYNEVCALQRDVSFLDDRLLSSFQIGTLGVLLLLISRELNDQRAAALLNYLYQKSDTDDEWSTGLTSLPKFSSIHTNFKYAGTLWRNQRLQPSDSTLSAIRQLFATRLSCKDLDSSLFLGPDEIRACCKRFFVRGIRKGDVVLLKANEELTLADISNAKQKLINRINTDTADECSGCPYIERLPHTQESIDYLSLENFAYCNMRCTYCSPKYYGGTEAKYNAAQVVEELALLPGGFAERCHVVWGGGEPTMSPRFGAINRSLMSMPQSGKIRVLSNSLK
ncbi:MAG: glycosyltransferase, partial [Gammaproteobacteria bacterium]|nr:glycosyltransferase [Gammaproteobacteria bacterium]